MRATTMMLCDSAEVVDGKLNIRGGGWSIITAPVGPTAMALRIDIPWDQADESLSFRAELMAADGAQLIRVDFARPPDRPEGIPHGVPVDSLMALPIPPLTISVGRYTWRLLEADGTPLEGASYLDFTVR